MMMHGLTLTRHDRPDRRAYAGAMEVMGSAFDPVYGEAWTSSQLAGMMSLPGTWLTIARLDGATLGFAVMRAVVDEAELLLLAVAPQWRGRSIGRALLDDCLAQARVRGIRSMHLEVRSTNDAIALYTKAGFRHVNSRPGYYRGSNGQLHDALSYRIEL